MRYYFHFAFGNSIEYDDEGQDFATLDAARRAAELCFRNFYLMSPVKKSERWRGVYVCITDATGYVHDHVYFLDALRGEHVCILAREAGEA